MIAANGRVLIGGVAAMPPALDVTTRGPLALLLGLLPLKQQVSVIQDAGLQIEANAAALQALVDALDPLPQGVDIITC